MAEDGKSGEEYLFEITAFLISSAKRCLGPEALYGPTRLVQTLNLLSHLPEYAPEIEGNSLLLLVREFVDGDPNWWHEEKLGPFLDRLSEELLQVMKRRLADD